MINIYENMSLKTQESRIINNKSIHKICLNCLKPIQSIDRVHNKYCKKAIQCSTARKQSEISASLDQA